MDSAYLLVALSCALLWPSSSVLAADECAAFKSAFAGEKLDSGTWARCVFSGNDGEGHITGTLILYQSSSNLLVVYGELSGFPNASERAIHVHQTGDLGEKCVAAGAHFNPTNVTHGDIGDDPTKRHAGDWGNIQTKPEGTIVKITDKVAKLTGKDNIMDKAIVMHGGKDDLGKGGNAGSVANGNAGARLGCCKIVTFPGCSSGNNSHPDHGSGSSAISASAVAIFLLAAFWIRQQ